MNPDRKGSLPALVLCLHVLALEVSHSRIGTKIEHTTSN